MANVLHHHIDFAPRPVSHAPSPFGFGFGLGFSNPPMSPAASSSWGTGLQPGHTNPAAFQQLASSMSQSVARPSKRRLDSEDDGGIRDESMDRSPTPERPKRAAPKRARLVPAQIAAGKENAPSSEGKVSGSSPDEVDVGVLLASLPTQSLLPLFMKLLKSRPELKSDVLSFIPKPTLETALQAIDLASKRLREAYPYSGPSNTVSFGFGSTMQQPHSHQGAMRDSYIISRIQPQITEFVSCCMSYLPYFTANCSSPLQPAPGSHLTQTIQSIHQSNSHPAETFAFLSRVMNHILSLPPLAVSSMAPLILPRLVDEWQTWVDGVDAVVNKHGGMFGSEAVSSWEGVLNELAETRALEVSTAMRPIRDKWVSKVSKNGLTTSGKPLLCVLVGPGGSRQMGRGSSHDVCLDPKIELWDAGVGHIELVTASHVEQQPPKAIERTWSFSLIRREGDQLILCMHNRAISLIASKAPVFAPATYPATFSLALQAAACRAWSRRVSTLVPTTSGVKARKCLLNTHVSRSAPDNDRLRWSGGSTRSVTSPGRFTSIDSPCPSLDKPASPSSSPTTDRCLPGDTQQHKGFRHSISEGESRASTCTSIAAPHDAPSSSIGRESPLSGLKSRPGIRRPGKGNDLVLPPQPSTPAMLCNNLNHLIRHTEPTPALPALIDYHDSFRGLQSTDSYNLLLSLAIYHATHPIFLSLLLAMRRSLIPRNLKTWQLEIRYLVQTDSWDQAWKEAHLYPDHIRPPQGEERPIPLLIWLELFGMPRRTASMSQGKRRIDGNEEALPGYNAESILPNELAIWNRRLRLLLDHSPREFVDFQGVKPYTVRAVIWCLLRLGHREEAMSITTAYFRSLPSALSSKHIRTCTEIINLNVALGSTGKGLAKLEVMQSTLRSLLDANPALRPDSNTLFLLLQPLQRARWCATKAQSVVRAFCTEWGDHLLGDRARRRVVSLALKGGRPDIAEKFAAHRKDLKGDKRASQTQTPVHKPASLPPSPRDIFKGSGKERVAWARARSRLKSAWESNR
ncbi:hypothetical protein NMY22_g580 [Coprinellus aureogranulatus]|nr:hypothetical protein NMY22_g580 [Coprinellus aureogranulatus]